MLHAFGQSRDIYISGLAWKGNFAQESLISLKFQKCFCSKESTSLRFL